MFDKDREGSSGSLSSTLNTPPSAGPFGYGAHSLSDYPSSVAVYVHNDTAMDQDQRGQDTQHTLRRNGGMVRDANPLIQNICEHEVWSNSASHHGASRSDPSELSYLTHTSHFAPAPAPLFGEQSGEYYNSHYAAEDGVSRYRF